MNKSENPETCSEPSTESAPPGGASLAACADETSESTQVPGPSEPHAPLSLSPEPPNPPVESLPVQALAADIAQGVAPPVGSGQTMQLPLGGPTSGSQGSNGGPSTQQHSPGSTSSVSSNGSAHVGYTRQSNPRPRSGKPVAASAPPSTGPPPSHPAAGIPPTTLSSLPPSAVTAPPYVPAPPMVMDYHPPHPPYGGGFIPAGTAPPGDVPHYGTVYYQPSPNYDGACYVSAPPPFHHPPGRPHHSGSKTSGPPPGGRYTPSPHSMSGSSSPSSYCQNSAVVSGAGGGPTAVNGSVSHGNNSNQHVVTYHVHSGEVISLQLGDGQVQVIPGPATIRMVSTNSTPPAPLPMQVPPGHMVQQILDQNGTLQHVILSLVPMGPGGPAPGSGSYPPPPPHPPGVSNAPVGGTSVPSGGIIHYGPAPPPGVAVPCSVAHPPGPPHISSSVAPSGGVYATPTSYSVAPNRSSTSTNPPGVARNVPVFCPNTIQYGPPPSVMPIMSTNVAPSGHSPPQQPPPGSPMGGAPLHRHPPHPPIPHHGPDKALHGGNPLRVRDATHERLKKKAALRQQFHHPQNSSSQHSTPATSPAKRGGGNRDSYRVNSSNVSGSPGGGSSGLLRKMSKSGSASIGGVDQSRHEDSEESGVGHEEEEEIQQLLEELLSNIRTPKVSDITARSTLLNWGPPIREGEGSKFDALEPISESEYRYEVLLSDKGEDGKYRSIFTGHSLECRLTDLRPCTEYHIRIHVHLENLKGGASDTVSFLTQSCEPDQPMPPKVIQRSKTSITLRWNAPSDNGAHIQTFILECEEALNNQGSDYEEVYRGRARNFNVTKLKSSTHYRFRLCAVNELGRSQYSEGIVFSTQGTAPSQPQPPGLREATKSSLHLVWSRRVTDDDFILQMDDMQSGHGFLTCYNGADLEYSTSTLRRNTEFKFRLQAINEEGKSHWSDEVTYSTLPDVPGPPVRPASKGRLHANSFKVRWDPPADNGGSPIKSFTLELDDGPNGWRTVYQGSECECVCENLTPGTQYKIKVACTSIGGVSQYSETCYITTEPICPGPCAPPRLHGKAKANSLSLKWGWPESDGGSQVTEFEIDMTSTDNQTRAVYRGQDTECMVASLLPGRPYLFQVRAHNRAGPGPWSESLEVVSGAGAPGQPKEPKVVCRSASLATITWEPPINNGALIQEYQLQIAVVKRTVVELRKQTSTEASAVEDRVRDDDSSSDEDLEHTEDELSGSDLEDNYKLKTKSLKKKATKAVEIDDEEQEEEAITYVEDIEPDFQIAYTGTANQFEAKSLEPASVYHFRLCAINGAGHSAWSNLTEIRTPAAPPSPVSSIRLQGSTSDSLSLVWTRPLCNGEPITHYNVDSGTAVLPTPGPDTLFVLRNLKPDSSYTIRVQAVNSIGPGPFSGLSRLSTRPLPPAPPKCECVHANHNSLKLKWGDSKVNAELCQYTLEMENSRNQFQVVYTGTSGSHKVNKLSENTRYRFRLAASNEAGPGAYSDILEYTTAYALPPPMKIPPRVSDITSDGCFIEWSPGKAQQTLPGDIQYKICVTRNRDGQPTIYSGTDCQWRLHSLDHKADYSVKVAIVRIPQPGLEVVGSYSPPGAFTTLPSKSGLDGSSHTSEDNQGQSHARWGLLPRNGEPWSIEQKAMVILFGFTVFAVLVAVLVQQLMAWGKMSP